MQVVVKKPRIKVVGDITQTTVDHLNKLYGKKNIEIIDDNFIPIDEVPWIREMMENRTPGDSLRSYRLRDKLTQQELADKIGEFKQNISNMEKGTRSISKGMARKLAAVFGTDYKRFL